MKADLDIKIADMDFSVDPWGQRMSTRIKNVLQRNGIMTLGQLMCTDVSELPSGLGIVGRLIIKVKLDGLGLSLPDKVGS